MAFDDDLRQLTDLHERGVITADELFAAKARLVADRPRLPPTREEIAADAARRAKAVALLTRLRGRGILSNAQYEDIERRLASLNADGSRREPTPEEAAALVAARARGHRVRWWTKWVIFPGWVGFVLSVAGAALVPRMQYLASFLCGGDTRAVVLTRTSSPYSGTTLRSSQMVCAYPDGTIETLHTALVLGTLFAEFVVLTWVLLGIREVRKRRARQDAEEAPTSRANAS